MYARVTIGELRPGKADEATRLWNEELPRYREGIGFLGGYLMIDVARDAMVSITFWEGAQYSQAHVDSGEMTRVLARFLEFLEEEPIVHGYEVTAQI